jgi:PAS domain S-box-containing protein
MTTSRLTTPSWMIAGLSLLSIVLLGAFLAIGAVRSRDEAIADAERDSRSQALALERHVARTIDSIDGAIQLIIEAMARTDPAAPEFHARLQRMASDHPQISRIAVVDAEGRLVQSSFDWPAGPVTYSDREFFAVHRDHPEVGLFINRPTPGRVISTWTIPISRRVAEADGRFAGAVVVALDPEYFKGFLEAINLGPKSVLTILRDDGTIVARAPRGDEWIGKSASSWPLFAKASPRPASASYRGALLDDRVERVISYRQVDNFPLVAAVGIATDDALADWKVFLREAVVLWFVAALLVATFTVVAFGALRRRAAVESKFRDLLESAPDGMIIIDPSSRISLVNAQAEGLFGYRREELLGQPLEILLPESNRDRYRAQLAAYLAEPYPRPMSGGFELMARRKDGSEFPIEISLSPLKTDRGVLVSNAVRDITVRARTDAELRATNQRLAALVYATPLALVELDRNGCVLSWNPAAEKMFGWRADEVLGRPVPTLPEAQRAEKLALLELRSGSPEVKEIETRAVRKDGSSLDVVLWSAPHFDAHGSVVGWIGIFADITEKKQAEDQLRQAHRLQAIGQLTGGVAHEFNNLLQVIVGNLDALADSVRGQREAVETIELVMRAARRGADLTQQLLSFSRKQSLHPKLFDPKEEIYRLEKLLRATIGANYKVVVDATADVSRVSADTTQLSNAILNLVLNSRDAMPAGGDICIRVRDTELDRADARRLDVVAGRYVSIEVIDYGVGMEPDVAQRAIEPFFTTKDVGRGTGLGLSMVHGFGRQSGGAIDIVTQQGRGTTVRLLLPAVAEPAGRAAEPPRLRLVPKRDATILVVEDEPYVLATSAALVRSLGYRVIEAADGPAALDALRAAGRVDALFTDIVMPRGMSGLDLAREASAYQPDLKVIYTSGYSDNVLASQGAIDRDIVLVPKPYTRAELASVMERVLGNGEGAARRRPA